MRSSNKLHYLIAFLMMVVMGISIFSITNFSEGQVNPAPHPTNVTVNNDPPVATITSYTDDSDSLIGLGGTLYPVAGPSTTTFTVFGYIRDYNEDPLTLFVWLHRENAPTCGVGGGNEYDCIRPPSCTGEWRVSGGLYDFECVFEIPYNADNTTGITDPNEGGSPIDYTADRWEAHAQAWDGTTLGTADVEYFELAQLAALGIQSGFSLGSVELGDYTSEVTTPFTNYGNTRIDPFVKTNNDFQCQGGDSIDKKYLRWSGTSQPYVTKWEVTSAFYGGTELFNLVKRPDGGPDSSLNIVWQLWAKGIVEPGICTLDDLVVAAVAG